MHDVMFVTVHSIVLLTLLTLTCFIPHSNDMTSWQNSSAEKISCNVAPFFYHHSVVIQHLVSDTLYQTGYAQNMYRNTTISKFGELNEISTKLSTKKSLWICHLALTTPVIVLLAHLCLYKHFYVRYSVHSVLCCMYYVICIPFLSNILYIFLWI
jgi:hypothetical protein